MGVEGQPQGLAAVFAVWAQAAGAQGDAAMAAETSARLVVDEVVVAQETGNAFALDAGCLPVLQPNEGVLTAAFGTAGATADGRVVSMSTVVASAAFRVSNE
jgi:hypothetical protein